MNRLSIDVCNKVVLSIVQTIFCDVIMLCNSNSAYFDSACP